MAYPTPQDFINCDEFIVNRVRLHLITDWRTRFPHIFVDYSIRYATQQDFYSPPALLNKQSVVVELKFAKQGCEAMTCYPFTATGVIQVNSPIGGYTQTSESTIQYNQPACFHLDRATALRDEEVQSVETRYTSDDMCIMVDSFTKMYFNTPFLRTEDRVSKGIDDVPAFNTRFSDNPVFPDKAEGMFNNAYCSRFARTVVNPGSALTSGCSQAWFEIFLGFVLGDTVYASFKMLATGVLGDMRSHTYDRPSQLLPPAPSPAGRSMLNEWLAARDDAFDTVFEKRFITHNDFGNLQPGSQLVYEAGKGYSYSPVRSNTRRSLLDQINAARLKLLHGRERRQQKMRASSPPPPNTLNSSEFNYNETDSLEDMIVDFLEDHSLIIGILTDLGLNVLEAQLEKLLKQVSSQILPILRNLLLNGSKTFTNRFAAEVYKAIVVNTVHRTLVRTVSTVAKMVFGALKMAMSVVNVILLFFTLVDFVLMIWDPYGYNNMFPRGYLDDLSNSFLGSLYDSVGVDDRNLIEVLPEMFMDHIKTTEPINAIDEQESDTLTVAAVNAIIYIDSLTHNSNGQLIVWDGDPLSDFDLESVVSAGLAANRNYEYFKWFVTRHNKVLLNPSPLVENAKYLGGFLLMVGGMLGVYKNLNRKRLMAYQQVGLSVLFLLFIILGVWLIMTESMKYYLTLVNHRTPAPPPRRKRLLHRPIQLKP
ncbi:pif-0/p74 [Spodoptera frugiperda granulovirus]|uniref:Pif-0/p74 n=1 Tax=Spodoptera frugiperda granulovirus TaxID=307454 RepID=A0A0C5ASD8_9BBAC|nr:pif-0/p74 [Spodoptera frugiperda granulovirus]AJK91722.1 pif-0/p74 [Spodoptera frugiperda granulovirus]